jgi:hypothetical protein
MVDDDIQTLNFKELIGEKELENFRTYVALADYRNFVINSKDNTMSENAYKSRDLTFPVDLCIRG